MSQSILTGDQTFLKKKTNLRILAIFIFESLFKAIAKRKVKNLHD